MHECTHFDWFVSKPLVHDRIPEHVRYDVAEACPMLARCYTMWRHCDVILLGQTSSKLIGKQSVTAINDAIIVPTRVDCPINLKENDRIAQNG